MRSIVKKSMLLGIGAAVIAQEKSMHYLHGLAKKGKLPEKEFKNYVKKISAETVKEAEKISLLVEKELSSAIKTGKRSSSKELKQLKKKVDDLAKTLETKGRKTVRKW